MNLKRFPAFVFQMCVFLALFHSKWKHLREGIFSSLLELKEKKKSKMHSSMAATWARKDVVIEGWRQVLPW